MLLLYHSLRRTLTRPSTCRRVGAAQTGRKALTIDRSTTKNRLQELVEEFLPTIRKSKNLAAETETFCERLCDLERPSMRDLEAHLEELYTALDRQVEDRDWETLVSIAQEQRETLDKLIGELDLDRDAEFEDFREAIRDRSMEWEECARAVDDLLLRPDAELRQHLESLRDYLGRLPDGGSFSASSFTISARVFATHT